MSIDKLRDDAGLQGEIRRLEGELEEKEAEIARQHAALRTHRAAAERRLEALRKLEDYRVSAETELRGLRAVAAERLEAIGKLEDYRLTAQAELRELRAGGDGQRLELREAHEEVARLQALIAARTGPRNLPLPAPVAAARVRLGYWRRPRLGILRQHPPEPLRVPRSYPLTRPPRPHPTISVVTPTFNQGDFLERTLRSVHGQGYPALEHVVQDGASTDGTCHVLERHSHLLAHVDSRPDGGQAHAINLGFAHGRGEIMGWLNSDDLLLPGALAYVARHFATHPEIDVVYGHRFLIDDRDRCVGRWVLPPHDERTLRMIDWVPQETMFWRRSIWERVGGCIDERLEFALDWDLLLRFSDAGAKIVRLPRYLGAFRVHNEGKTSVRVADVGSREVAAIRERLHGRTVSQRAALEACAPYLRRHVLLHTGHRALARLPLPRTEVLYT